MIWTRYLIGIVLCAVVSYTYAAARNDGPRKTLREGTIVFSYIIVSLIALAIVVYALCRLK